MHSKINVLLVILFMTIGLSSCNPSIPKEDPDLGIDIDMSQLNTTLQVDTPKKINTYRIGKQVELEIENLSDQDLQLSPDEIQIFRAEDDKWEKVGNDMKTIIIDDFKVEPNEVDNPKYLVLKPKGPFPDDKLPISILPNVKSNKTVLLRIFVLAHRQESESVHPNTIGAYVDIILVP